MLITIGAPIREVTELIERSVGANAVLAIKSQPRQNIAPPRKHMGIITTGFDVLIKDFIRCGTAIPTKEIGPAKAVTAATRTLDKTTSATRKAVIFTPMLLA
jgi:hypothetical protein